MGIFEKRIWDDEDRTTDANRVIDLPCSKKLGSFVYIRSVTTTTATMVMSIYFLDPGTSYRLGGGPSGTQHPIFSSTFTGATTYWEAKVANFASATTETAPFGAYGNNNILPTGLIRVEYDLAGGSTWRITHTFVGLD